jgi:hypothetical protein
LYVNRCSDPNIYAISPQDGSLQVDKSLLEEEDDPKNWRIRELPAAMTYDPTRNGLWIGTQMGDGGTALRDCGSVGMPIYFWAFNEPGSADDTVTPVFTILFSDPPVNPVTGTPFFSDCFIAGIAYNESTGQLWISDDRNRNIGVFQTDGSFVAGYDATRVDISLFNSSGLAIGGERLYLANGSIGDVFRAAWMANPLQLLGDGPFMSGNRREQDMACDPDTFFPKAVVWVRTDPQHNAGNDLLTAYEIEPGGCGTGPVIGACCDANAAPCRDVPQSQCQGPTEVWTQGVLCSALDPPCHEMHRIILLDRTGSMQAPFDENTTRCERARQTAIADVMAFFAQNPIGASVAVWTFRGTAPTELTPGFVDEATAIAALEGLAGVNCSGLTPLAESLCDAVDALLAAYPSALASTLEFSVSTDGEENNSDGPCAGPSSTIGSKCVSGDPNDLFEVGSWQRKVCDHTVGNAVVPARLWGDLSMARAAKQTDAETGALLASGVSDAVFFEALAEATGGTFTFIDDFPPEPTGTPAFGVTGACCLPDATCQEAITEAECAVLGGAHQGEASLCANANGACCLPDGTCQDAVTESACAGQGGSFPGTCTTCAAHVVGACCLPDESCQDGITPAECAAENGTHQGGCTACTGEPGECPAPIPAVSEWGIFVLTLLVLVGGTIILGQRSRMEA